MSIMMPDTRPIPTPRDTCPWWCTDPHTGEPFLDSDGSTLVVHRWHVTTTAGHHVQVRAGVFIEPDGSVTPSSVEVVLDSEAMSVEDAHRLRAALGVAAALAGGAR